MDGVTSRNYGLVAGLDELAQFQHRLITAGEPFGFDIETGYLGPDAEKYSLHPEVAILVGFSFTNDPGWARYLPLRHDVGENLDNREVARLLWPLLATGRGVAHNATFELRHLSRWFVEQLADDPEHGEAVRAAKGYFPVRSDTQIEAYLAADFQSFGLKFLTRVMFDRHGVVVHRDEWPARVRRLEEIARIKEPDEREAAEVGFDGQRMTELYELFPDLPKNRRKMLRFNVLDPADPAVIDYACEDASACLAIHQRYHPEVSDRLLYRVEMGVLDCVCEMEDLGVRYDWAHLARGAEDLRGFRDRFNAEIMAELSTLVGEPTAINLASPKQVGAVLYEQLGYRTAVYTATSKDKPLAERKMSTGAIALASLAKRQPVVKKILQWKEMTRLLGTYLDVYEAKYGYAADGHTHPHHLSAVVVTGRFAVADPPYQQSPKVYHYDLEPARAAHAAHADAHGSGCDCAEAEFVPAPGTCFRFNFRDAIVAPPDHYILGFDLSMAELRAIAGEANETALLDAFAHGTDVHSLTAALMLRVPVGQVSKDQRDIGKTMNFALLYGMQAKSLGERLGIDTDEAQALYDRYFAAYPAIAVWAERQVRHGKQHGYVTSRFGRKLPIWEYRSDNRWIQSKGDRACVNYPIQGGATGDFMKIAMVRARKALRATGLHDQVHLVMNVHDALEFYVHRDVRPERVIAVLQPAVIFDVPGWPSMAADWHIAKRWGSQIDVVPTPDGGLVVKGDRVVELAPAVEADEDTGEQVEVMPDVDLDTLRHLAFGTTVTTVTHGPAPTPSPDQVVPVEPDSDPEPGPADDGTGRRVVLAVAEMPTPAGYQRLLAHLRGHPGPNTLMLRTPAGDLPLELPGGCALGPADTAVVSMMIGPASVTYDAADVDPAEVVAGLAF